MSDAVPVIDIAPFAAPHAHDDDARAACAASWDQAMAEVGFALIIGHGVEKEKIESLRAAFREFFANRDLEYKKQFAYGPYGKPNSSKLLRQLEPMAMRRQLLWSDFVALLDRIDRCQELRDGAANPQAFFERLLATAADGSDEETDAES